MRCKPPTTRPCSPSPARLGDTLPLLVRTYRIRNRPGSVDELAFFCELPSIELAIHYAALATDRRGKRFSHQCRISLATLRKAKAALEACAPQISRSQSFHALHQLVREILQAIRGVGELYVYDTALRLGAFLRVSPEHVYLHAGTRAGARALGLDLSEGFVRVASLPKPIQTLRPHEIEDFLCIYKGQLTSEG